MSKQNENENNDEKLGSTSLLGSLRVIDLDNPFFFGVGRDMNDKEKKSAIEHGRLDNLPMSVLGVTEDGIAAVDGRETADLFAAAPDMLKALTMMQEALEQFMPNVANCTLSDYQIINDAPLAAKAAIKKALGSA